MYCLINIIVKKCGNYGIGGHYWTHPDYHHPDPKYEDAHHTGNRVATVLTVLEAPKAGSLYMFLLHSIISTEYLCLRYSM